MIVLLGGFLLLMIFGVPVAVSMAVASLAYLAGPRRRTGCHRRPAHDRGR